ncbi:DeoR/GlpR family DNA-binding transcription regulator [Oxalobacteraceae bacterium A2-2]
MDYHDRHKRLLRLLAEHGAATIPQLSGWLGVSPATVRRDVRLLDLTQQVKRVHGGARRMEGASHAPLNRVSFDGSMDSNAGRKRAIARHAVSLCGDGDTIVIGGGTTTFRMAEFMAARQMRVLTNSFEVARRLLATSDNDVILSGGTIYRNQGIVLSPFETETVQFCYANRLFLGAHSLSSFGVMEADPLLIQASGRLIHQAQELVVLADSSKFANKGSLFLCSLDKIARVITDTGAPDAGVQMLERAGVKVTLVEPEPPSMPAAPRATTVTPNQINY